MRAGADTVVGAVVSISEGDTLTMIDSDNRRHNIRLAWIDAPDRAAVFWDISRQHLFALAYGKRAKAECYSSDRYGRALCSVEVDGKDLGLEQLNAGLAWWLVKHAHTQSPWQRMAYEAAQRNASALRRGLWRSHNTAPTRE